MFVPTPNTQCQYWLDISNSGGIAWQKEFVMSANLDDLYSYFMCKRRFYWLARKGSGKIAALRGKEFAVYLMNKIGSVKTFEKVEITLLLNEMCTCGVYRVGDDRELLEAVQKAILQEEQGISRDWMLENYEKMVECTGDNFPSEKNMDCGR